ncbi:MAG: hypothetical protein ACK481_03040, partial [Candidatus Melainabacteria bacterium]
EQIQQIRIHLESLTEFIESEKQIKEEIQSVSVQLAALNSRGLGEIQHSELDTLEQKLSQISSSTQLQMNAVGAKELNNQINRTRQNLSLELSKQIEEKTKFFNKLIEAPTNKPAQSFTSSSEIEKYIENLENQLRGLVESSTVYEEHVALKQKAMEVIPLHLEELRNVVTLLKNAEAVHAQVNQLSEQPLSESSTVSLESNIQKLQTKQTQLKKQVEFLGNNSNAGLALQTVISSIEERLNNLDTEIQTRYELGNSLKELIKTPTNKPAQSFTSSTEIQTRLLLLEKVYERFQSSTILSEEHIALKEQVNKLIPLYLEELQNVATQLKNAESVQAELNQVSQQSVLEQITESPKGSIEELQAWQTQLEEELQSLNKNSNAFSVVQNVLKEVKQRLSKIENALEFFKSLDLPFGDKTLAKEIQAAEESLQEMKINFKKQETGSPFRLAYVTHKVLPPTYNQETGVIEIPYHYVPDPGQGIYSESQTAKVNLKTGGLSLQSKNQFTSGRINYLIKSNGNGAMTFDDYKNSVGNLLTYISSKLIDGRIELVSVDTLSNINKAITRLYLLKQAKRLFC